MIARKDNRGGEMKPKEDKENKTSKKTTNGTTNDACKESGPDWGSGRWCDSKNTVTFDTQTQTQTPSIQTIERLEQ